MKNNPKFDAYLKTYTGTQLLKEHKLDDVGTWEVRGEDPNCDLGGPHSNPFIGIYEGKLSEVITLAVELPGFWTWGGGGEIKKVTVNVVSKPTNLSNRPKCLGFTKTLVLNKDEHTALNHLLDDIIKFCRDNPVFHGSDTEARFLGLKEKLNVPESS